MTKAKVEKESAPESSVVALAREKKSGGVPIYRNAVLFTFLAIAWASALLIAEVWMTMAGYPGGLPESVTTALFGVVTTILGYAGACIQHRQKEP